MGHGILEFSTEKAGQDVTPLNLQFNDNSHRSHGINSISGKKNMLLIKIYFTDF